MSVRSNAFRLNKSEGKIMGVCAGLADYSGVDATIVRIAAVALTLLGWIFWRWERNVCKRLPACPQEIVAVEPPNQL